MIRRRKAALWTIGGLIVAILLGALALHALIDQERLKTLARDKAQAAWSRELTIGGLSLQFLPLPVIQATDVSLANPSWAHHKNMLQAARVTANLELLPLLTGQVRIKHLSVGGLRANLEMSPDGHKSWDLNAARASRGKTPGGAAGFDLLHLKALHVLDADIGYRGHDAAAIQWHIDDASAEARSGWRNVRIDARLTRNRYPLTIHARFDDLSQIGVKGAVSDGAIDLRWQSAQGTVTGKIPLEIGLQGHVVRTDFAAESLTGMLGFFGIHSLPTAAIKASADLRESEGSSHATNLKISLGKLNVTGEAQLTLTTARPVIHARVAVDRLDWVQALLDAGRPALPPKPPTALFRTNPLDWQALAGMRGIEGTLDVQLASLKLRSGIELKNAKARMAFHDDQLNMHAFSANLLGGAASGSMQFDGSKKHVQVHLDATDISLGQWFAERGKKVAFTGGPMKIKASVSMSGASMKDLAASITGPVTIDMGHAAITSRKAEQAEEMLTGLLPMLSVKNANQVDLACVGAQLPFVSGRAEAIPIVGVRSNASKLLMTGFIDLRRQTLDLRGRVKAASGVSLGISTLTGDVKITGKIMHPYVGLDPAGTPAGLTRLGAAILTGGVSILGIALWDAANPGADPCRIALAAQTGDNAKKPGKSKRRQR